MHRHTCGILHATGRELRCTCVLWVGTGGTCFFWFDWEWHPPLTLCLSWKHPSASPWKEWPCSVPISVCPCLVLMCCPARSRDIVARRPKLNRQYKLYRGHLPSTTWFQHQHSLGWKLTHVALHYQNHMMANVIQRFNEISSWRSFLAKSCPGGRSGVEPRQCWSGAEVAFPCSLESQAGQAGAFFQGTRV